MIFGTYKLHNAENETVLRLCHYVNSYSPEGATNTSTFYLHYSSFTFFSIFIQIFTVSSERRTCFETECIMTLQAHPMSLILAPIESAYMTSYSTLIATLSYLAAFQRY